MEVDGLRCSLHSSSETCQSVSHAAGVTSRLMASHLQSVKKPPISPSSGLRQHQSVVLDP